MTHAHPHADPHADLHAHTHADEYARTRADAHAHTHADAHARIGAAFLAARHLPRPATRRRTLGTVTLLPHQEAAIAPLVARLRHLHGALLADAPGLGKTYVALAVADALHVPRPLVLAPAALRTRWLDAARDTATRIRFVSLESLGRTDPDSARHAHDSAPLVIVDEAHHLRTMATRRWHAAAALCEGARVLLLSATPVHNRGHDAVTLAALFHVAPGSRRLARLLRRITVQRPLDAIRAADPDALAALDLPTLTPVRTLTIASHDASLPHRIERLPPLPLDADPAAHARTRLALLHAWASSSAALAAMLRRRIARCLAIEAALDAGIAPDPHVVRAWHTDAEGTAVQLALAPLLAHPTPTSPATTAPDDPSRDDRTHADFARADATHTATTTHRLALEALLRSLSTHDDDARARALRRLARWSAAPVVAFTRSRVTARALWRRLRASPGTALLTGDDAAIASGTVPRDELLAMLRAGAPRAAIPHGSAAAGVHARRITTDDATVIRLLVTTDVAAEGLSLAGTRTVVHLDDPWTPARLAQRAGRAARLGAPVASVRVIRLTLPAALPCIARVRHILARKRSLLAHTTRAIARDLSPADEVDIVRIARRWCLAEHERPPTTRTHAPRTPRHAPAAPDAPAHACEWLVAFRTGAAGGVRGTADGSGDHVGTADTRGRAGVTGHAGTRPRATVHIRVVRHDGTVRRASAADWRAADDARAGHIATTHATVPSSVCATLARWWRARADPLDRVLRRDHDARASDAPALARLRRLVDVALAGASPVERAACVRGAERARVALRTGTAARTLDTLARQAADPVAARRWLAALAANSAVTTIDAIAAIDDDTATTATTASSAPATRSTPTAPAPAAPPGARAPAPRRIVRHDRSAVRLVAAVPLAAPAIAVGAAPLAGRGRAGAEAW